MLAMQNKQPERGIEEEKEVRSEVMYDVDTRRQRQRKR